MYTDWLFEDDKRRRIRERAGISPVTLTYAIPFIPWEHEYLPLTVPMMADACAHSHCNVPLFVYDENQIILRCDTHFYCIFIFWRVKKKHKKLTKRNE